MIHARTDYDRIQDPAGLIGEDEPVMLFRAKDRLMHNVLAAYRDMLVQVGAEPHMVESVERHIDRVTHWQVENGTQTPDMPADAVRPLT